MKWMQEDIGFKRVCKDSFPFWARVENNKFVDKLASLKYLCRYPKICANLLNLVFIDFKGNSCRHR